ncbi:DUF1835 domain-containing protein [uncultured Pontibacter sp.]|uniref:DUF1835 domain-containing protein n=1 Tax=uncultured Pontibacter sp. TaxID=453356 RepID=UPI0026195493|nr:DUF1835 domain-containing protein [uncultured Pontibacter sp.]
MKKLPTLHLINGDASLDAFEAANFPGQVLIWREVLSEGPVIGSLPEQAFWQKRQEYITAAYHEKPEAYQQKVLTELEKLNNAQSFFEVILWFDADLMCQLNLLYLLQKLSKVKPATISVCTPAGNKNIGYSGPKELHAIFEKRLVITPAHLREAERIWQLYAGPDPLQLQLFVRQNEILLPNLKEAIYLHLLRFPNCKTGLSQPETLLLKIIEEGAHTLHELVQQFSEQQPSWGFGDGQLERILQHLQPALVSPQEPLNLTEKGQQVLQGLAVHVPAPAWLGGAHLQAQQMWCHNTLENKLEATQNLA